jgi:hypothetical protein
MRLGRDLDRRRDAAPGRARDVRAGDRYGPRHRRRVACQPETARAADRRPGKAKKIDPFPQTLRPPRVEVAPHCRAVWKIARQQTPGTSGGQNVTQASTMSRRGTNRGRPRALLRRHMGLAQRPFCIRHDTRVTKDLPDDTAGEWFQSACCVPQAFLTQLRYHNRLKSLKLFRSRL